MTDDMKLKRFVRYFKAQDEIKNMNVYENAPEVVNEKPVESNKMDEEIILNTNTNFTIDNNKSNTGAKGG